MVERNAMSRVFKKGVHYKTIVHPRHRYELLVDVITPIPSWGGKDMTVDEGWVSVKDGFLFVRRGYRWDGSSGPSWHTPSTFRASLNHDAWYQATRENEFGTGFRKVTARLFGDKLYFDLLREDGMWLPRAVCHFLAVVIFGGRFGVDTPGGFHAGD
jgi:hypothetical protein